MPTWARIVERRGSEVVARHAAPAPCQPVRWVGGAVLGIGAVRSWQTETRQVVNHRPDARAGVCSKAANASQSVGERASTHQIVLDRLAVGRVSSGDALLRECASLSARRALTRFRGAGDFVAVSRRRTTPVGRERGRKTA